MKEVKYLTEEEIVSIVDRNNVKTAVYEIFLRSYNESVSENIQSFFRTMSFKNWWFKILLKEHR